MKKIITSLLLLTALGAGVFLVSCSRGGDHGGASASETKILYICGMDRQIIRDHPGNCPICGMKLTPIRAQDLLSGASAPSGAIAVNPVTMQNMDIRTAVVERGPLRRTIRAAGTVDYNETTIAEVSTKFKGWIEKLDANATGQLVMKGDPLFEIYSPELYSAQVEYLFSLNQPGKTDAGGDSIKTSALTKLKFFDISDAQIAELERTRQPRKTLSILAPQDGFVIEKDVVEGQMVEAGMKIYRLADLGLVWVQAQIYEQDLAYLKLGQEATVTLSFLPDRIFRGRVTHIHPDVDEKTRTAKVRMEFHNPGYFLKPGMFATVQISSQLEPSALLVPDMAVLRSGEKTTVFVALDDGKFEPRAVTLGPQAENDMYQVLDGLKEGERIVTSGQFLLDSESQLREAVQKMQRPGRLQTNVAVAAASKIPAETNLPAATPATLQPGGKVLYYTCPMPEHSDVHEDKPGKCPRCGMTLIPVMEAQPVLQSAATTNAIPDPLYTCAMHLDVVSDEPGKCPKCGMDLMPASDLPEGKIAEANWLKQHPPVQVPAVKHQP